VLDVVLLASLYIDILLGWGELSSMQDYLTLVNGCGTKGEPGRKEAASRTLSHVDFTQF